MRAPTTTMVVLFAHSRVVHALQKNGLRHSEMTPQSCNIAWMIRAYWAFFDGVLEWYAPTAFHEFPKRFI